ASSISPGECASAKNREAANAPTTSAARASGGSRRRSPSRRKRLNTVRGYSFFADLWANYCDRVPVSFLRGSLSSARASRAGPVSRAFWRQRGRSDGRSRCLERKGEERGDAEKHEGDEIIPREFLLQKRNREADEDDERDNLLNDLELESRELAIAEAICRHRQAVFEQRDRPRDHDRFPKRPGVTVFQVPIPSEGHEDVRQNQQKDGGHRVEFRNRLSRVSGMRKQRMPNAAAETAARKRKPALEPKRCTMEPGMTWLSEAPMPTAVPMAPRVRLKRPVPCVGSAIPRTDTTPNIPAATPSRIWIATSSPVLWVSV